MNSLLSYPLRLTMLLAVFLGLHTSASAFNGKNGIDTLYFDLSKDLGEQLIPLENIIQIAQKHSPLLKQQDIALESRQLQIRMLKLTPMVGLSLFGNYAMGTQLSFASTSSSDVIMTLNGYRAGVNFTFSLSDLMTRRTRMDQLRNDYRLAQTQRDLVKLDVRREVNRVYHALITAQRLLRVRIREEQQALIAFQAGEIDVQRGRMNQLEFLQLSTLYSNSQVQTETQRGSFLTTFYELEALVGVDIHVLRAPH